MRGHDNNKYASFVEHPRFGRGPRITGLNPKPSEEGVHLHSNSVTYKEVKAAYERVFGRFPGYHTDTYRRTKRIPNTAVVANLDQQTPATVPVTHYFDVECRCSDCDRSFIFFAEEQKYWYEQLGFKLDADCVRCHECRRKQRGLERQRAIYESLYHVPDRTVEQNLEMAEACVSLIEATEFTHNQTQHVRMLLNAVPESAPERRERRFADLVDRLAEVEKKRADPSATAQR